VFDTGSLKKDNNDFISGKPGGSFDVIPAKFIIPPILALKLRT